VRSSDILYVMRAKFTDQVRFASRCIARGNHLSPRLSGFLYSHSAFKAVLIYGQMLNAGIPTAMAPLSKAGAGGHIRHAKLSAQDQGVLQEARRFQASSQACRHLQATVDPPSCLRSNSAWCTCFVYLVCNACNAILRPMQSGYRLISKIQHLL